VEVKAKIAGELEARVWPLLGNGTIKPVIDQALPLEHADEAHRRMEAGANIGKILLEVK
jgi:NADPH2:quinone reductase